MGISSKTYNRLQAVVLPLVTVLLVVGTLFMIFS